MLGTSSLLCLRNIMLIVMIICQSQVAVRAKIFSLSLIDRSFFEAEDDCVNRGGHLATILSATEQNNLRIYLEDNLPAEHGQVWIGLNDINNERGTSRTGWVWVSGAPFSFHSFGSGEPGNQDPIEDCIVAQRTINFDWQDRGCNAAKVYVCEFPDPTSAPTTSKPTTSAPTTSVPTTSAPTTSTPTTSAPTTSVPTTSKPTTSAPTTSVPTTSAPTTSVPTTSAPTTSTPTTREPTTANPTLLGLTGSPTTATPTNGVITLNPTNNDNGNGDQGKEEDESNNIAIIIGGGVACISFIALSGLLIYVRNERKRNLMLASMNGSSEREPESLQSLLNRFTQKFYLRESAIPIRNHQSISVLSGYSDPSTLVAIPPPPGLVNISPPPGQVIPPPPAPSGILGMSIRV